MTKVELINKIRNNRSFDLRASKFYEPWDISDETIKDMADDFYYLLKDVLNYLVDKEESVSEGLDFLVISLEETIGTSPHSREVIKEHLQKAAEWGRNHFEDKSEMVSEDLEEEINNYFKDWTFDDEMSVMAKPNHYFAEFNDIKDIARHFAEWQKKKDQETIELAEDHAMLAGMNRMKEEMMKDAVDGEYWDGSIYLDNRPTEYKDGDKVKIIIVKEN